MKVLVTGGTGLAGCQIDGIKVSSSDYNLTKFDDTLSMFIDHTPDVVIHTAGKVGGINANMVYKGEFFYDNIMINTNILECCRIFKVQKVVSFLSTCIFPDKVEYPLTEDKVHLGPPHESNYAYAYSKRMIDIQSKAYRDQYGLNAISVSPTNMYGPNDNYNLDNGHLIPSLIHKCYLAKNYKDTDFVVWGSGNPLREFIYSKDVANIIKYLIDNYDDPNTVILSNSHEISIKDVANIIAEEFGYDGKIIFDKSKPDGQYRKPTCNNKLKSIIDYDFTDIRKGLKESINWFCENYPNIRGVDI